MPSFHSPGLRILHIDDEWRSWQFIPHQLFDRLFDALPTQDREGLNILDEPNTNAGSDWGQVCVLNDITKQVYFSYIFLPSPGAITRFKLTQQDIVIIDLMSPSDQGLTFGESSRTNAIAAGALESNLVYFSALPTDLIRDRRDNAISEQEQEAILAYVDDRLPDFQSKVFRKSAATRLSDFLLGRLLK